jgi:preprotein translocase subunit SecF
MHLFPKTHFDFLAWRWRFFTLSGILLGGSVLSLATKGIKYGIDFTGGTVLQITFDKPMELARLRAAIEKAGLENAAIQHFAGGAQDTFSIRVQADPSQSAAGFERQIEAIQAGVGDDKFHVDKKEYVGPAVGRHLARQATWAIVLSLGGIIFYLGFRFANPLWGVAGIIALFQIGRASCRERV